MKYVPQTVLALRVFFYFFVTNWPWPWPPGRSQRYSYRYSYVKNATNIGFLVFSAIGTEKTKEPTKTCCFLIFCTNMAKNTGLRSFWAFRMQKINEHQSFSKHSAKYLEKNIFYKVPEHSACKNKRKLVVLNMFNKMLQKVQLIMFFKALDTKTKETQWCFNISGIAKIA